MTSYSFGDTVLVKFVFSEGDEAKLRPAAVLSTEEYHRGRQELIMAAVTSNIERQLFGDTKLSDWESVGLLYPSVVTAILRTIKQDMVVRKLGVLSGKDMRAIKANLKKAVGFVVT